MMKQEIRERVLSALRNRGYRGSYPSLKRKGATLEHAVSSTSCAGMTPALRESMQAGVVERLEAAARSDRRLRPRSISSRRPANDLTVRRLRTDREAIFFGLGSHCVL